MMRASNFLMISQPQMWWRPYPLKGKLTVIVIGGVIQKLWELRFEPIHLLRMYKQSWLR